MQFFPLLLLLFVILMVVFDIINKQMNQGITWFRWAVALFLILNSGLISSGTLSFLGNSGSLSFLS